MYSIIFSAVGTVYSIIFPQLGQCTLLFFHSWNSVQYYFSTAGTVYSIIFPQLGQCTALFFHNWDSVQHYFFYSWGSAQYNYNCICSPTVILGSMEVVVVLRAGEGEVASHFRLRTPVLLLLLTSPLPGRMISSSLTLTLSWARLLTTRSSSSRPPVLTPAITNSLH